VKIKDILIILFLVSGISYGEKVVSVFYTGKPPVIDGYLNDRCWKDADVISDFTPLYSLPLEPTKVRMVYDKENLYIGIEILTKSPEILHRKIEEIRSKKNFSEGLVHIRDFTNLCSVEIFIDPGATMRNHYQILFNAAGQICGHYKYQWEDVFPVLPYGKARMTDTGWSAEIVIPRLALENTTLDVGREWGFNIVRNDLQPVSIWKDVGPVFNTPSQFGRMVIGDYKDWWYAVWEEGVVRRFKTISEELKQKGNIRPDIYNMYLEIKKRIGKEKRQRVDLSDRKGFLNAYRRYSSFYPLFHRFEAYYHTYRSMQQ